jgi:hypothetical protein
MALEQHLIGTTNESRKSVLDASVVALLPGAVLPCQYLDAALIHSGQEPLDDEKQVAFQQGNRNSGADGSEDQN